MITANDIAALRRLQDPGPAPAIRARSGEGDPVRGRDAADAAARARAREVRGVARREDPFAFGARERAFWRDSAARLALSPARWVAIWIEGAAAAMAWQTRALLHGPFG